MLVSFSTCAVDTENIRRVFNDCRDIIQRIHVSKKTEEKQSNNRFSFDNTNYFESSLDPPDRPKALILLSVRLILPPSSRHSFPVSSRRSARSERSSTRWAFACAARCSMIFVVSCYTGLFHVLLLFVCSFRLILLILSLFGYCFTTPRSLALLSFSSLLPARLI